MPPDKLEFQSKIRLLRRLLEKHVVDALLLRRASSFTWATCGAASYVNTAISEGAASLLITPEHLYLFTNVVEAPRLEQEEDLAQQGWEFHISPWEAPLQELHRMISALSLASDVAFPGAKDIIALGQVIAWNPTIAGSKVEDTILVGPECNDILTRTSLWPVAAVQVPGVPGEVPCALALEV